jgi:hypothetical protein
VSEFEETINKLYFLDVDDFYDNVEYIKSIYKGLDYMEKNIYKWYFYYQLCLVKDKKNNPLKSIFWDYLNDKTSRKIFDYSYTQFMENKPKIIVKDDNLLTF